MAFDMNKLVGALGDEAIGKIGEPLGLSKEQSVRLAKALAARAGLGGQEMIKAAAADENLDEEVVAAMSKKLVEEGKDKVMEESGANAAIANAKNEAMAAARNAGGGLLGKLFGRG